MTLRLDRVIAALALIASCSPALAQQPTQAQIGAVRSNCRSDFMSNCSGVRPGGADALRCLKDHMARLSPGCHAAVSAIGPPAPKVAAPSPAPAPAAPPTAPAEPAAPAAAAPSEPAAPVAAPATPPAPPVTQPSAASAPPAPTAPGPNRRAPQPNRAAATAPAAPPAPATQPTSLLPLPPLAPRVRIMIVRNCIPERRVICPNVPAGGGIVECLAEHGDALSPRCRNAILSVK